MGLYWRMDARSVLAARVDGKWRLYRLAPSAPDILTLDRVLSDGSRPGEQYRLGVGTDPVEIAPGVAVRLLPPRPRQGRDVRMVKIVRGRVTFANIPRQVEKAAQERVAA